MTTQKKKSILIVDDDTELLNSNKDILEADGYTVITAHNGICAIEKAKELLPSLILMDVMMDSVDEGFQTSRAFKALETTKDIPIIILTGIKKSLSLPFNFEPDEEWLPVKAVLEKPVNPKTLLAEIKKAIG